VRPWLLLCGFHCVVRESAHLGGHHLGILTCFARLGDDLGVEELRRALCEGVEEPPGDLGRRRAVPS
jgi:hypothetical protein